MTIQGVAKLAGVSVSTVSKVMNNKADSISEATKNRILSIIAQNDYVPYRKVMDQVSKNSSIVALMVSDVSDIFSAELLRGVEDFFSAKEFGVIVCNTDESMQKESAYIHMLKKQNVRGVIRFPILEPDDERIRSFEDEDIFSVILDDYKRTPNALKTYFNNKEGGAIATRHLIEAGHRRIGYISLKTQRPYQLERLSGYLQALEEHGIEQQESLIYIEDKKDRKQCGYGGAKYLMSQKVTAIFCCDDHVAAGVYRAIQESGLKIPEDISVVGFDDSLICELLDPNLTSINQSAYDIGWSSAEMLFAKLNGLPLEQGGVQIQPHLVTRSSVTPPGAKHGAGRQRCLVIGEIQADVLMDVAQAPDAGRQKARTMQVKAGGWAVQKAAELLEADVDVYLIGCIGDDAYGRQVYNSISGSGIKTDGVVFLQTYPTGTAFITIAPEGARSEIVYAGANAALADYPLRDISWMFEKADCCMLGPDIPEALAEGVRALCTAGRIKLL